MIDFNKNVISVTDVGLVRKANEDNYGLAQTPNGDLFVVCDGMGGHVGGAIASKIAVNCILNFFKTQKYENIKQALHDALCSANTEILNEVQKEPNLKGMGTTACVVLVQSDEIWFAYVGDSRIYLRTNNQLHRITKDHSFVQGLVDQGMISDAEAEKHPQKNRILKALGIIEDLRPTVCTEALHPAKNDIILICTDGLSGMVNDLTMQATLAKANTLQEKSDELITLAKRAGGSDNITAILIQTENSPYKTASFISFSPKENIMDMETQLSGKEKAGIVKFVHKREVIYAFTILLIAIIGYAGYKYWHSNKSTVTTETRPDDKKEEDGIVADSITKKPQMESLSDGFVEKVDIPTSIGKDYYIAVDVKFNPNSLNDLSAKEFKNEADAYSYIKSLKNKEANFNIQLYFNKQVKGELISVKNLKWLKSVNGKTAYLNEQPETPDENQIFEETTTILISEVDNDGDKKNQPIKFQYTNYFQFYKNGKLQNINSSSKMKSGYMLEAICLKNAKAYLDKNATNKKSNYKCIVYNHDNKEIETLECRNINWRVTKNKVQIGVYKERPDLEKIKKELQNEADNLRQKIELQLDSISIDYEFLNTGILLIVQPTDSISQSKVNQEKSYRKKTKK